MLEPFVEGQVKVTEVTGERVRVVDHKVLEESDPCLAKRCTDGTEGGTI